MADPAAPSLLAPPPAPPSASLLNSAPAEAPEFAGLSALPGIVGDWITQQRAKSVQMGLLDPATGLPTPLGAQHAAMALAMGLGTGDVPEGGGITAYHGSPYSFEKFDPTKIGTGEGAQAYGHGLYFAESEPVARTYKENLSGQMSPEDAAAYTDAQRQAVDLGRQVEDLHTLAAYHSTNKGMPLDPDWGEIGMQYHPEVEALFRPKIDALTAQRNAANAKAQDILSNAPRNVGSMYQVNLQADPEHFLDWDKPLSEQSQYVQDALSAWDAQQPAGQQVPTLVYGPRQPGQPQPDFVEPSGQGIYKHFSAVSGNDFAAGAQALQDAGIRGIRYLDQGSRGAGQGTSNYAVFNPDIINIIRKYGITGLIGGGVAGIQGQRQQAP